MSRWYLDTSAAAKLLVTEAESAELAAAITAERPVLVACCLLETEVRRLVHRFEDLTQQDATELLDGVNLHEMPLSLYREAGLLPGDNLRALDALHLAAATRIGAHQVLTYDSRMIAAARDVGMPVLAPGLTD